MARYFPLSDFLEKIIGHNTEESARIRGLTTKGHQKEC